MKKALIILILVAIITGCASDTMKSSLTEVNLQKEVQSTEEVKETINIRPVEESSTNNDIEIINYVNNLEDEVISLTNSDITSTTKEKLKNTFITLTDFIFYDGTINNITFNELSISVQEKILETYTNIDKIIESYYPNYKETIKTTSQNIYTNIIEQANILKEKYKQKIGEETYNNNQKIMEEDLNNLKDNLLPTVDYIKEKSQNTYEELKEKANNWYQNYKESSE